MVERDFSQMTEAHEIEHSQAELLELYNYPIDTYGVDSQEQQTGMREGPEAWDMPALPKLTGVAAVKAALFGDRRIKPNPAPLPIYTCHLRTVDMPVVPARHPNDTRSACLFRRFTPAHGIYPEGTQLLFTSWKQRSAEESRRRNLGRSGNLTYDGVFKVLLKDDRRPETQRFKQNETSNLWFEYLTRVKDYRESGEYERSSYGPFIEQNLDFLRAVEARMDLQENDQEVQRDAKQVFDKEQIERSKQYIEGWLADVPVPEWTYVEPHYWYELEGDYYVRRRQVELRSPAESSVPTLSILEYQSENEKIGFTQRRGGLLTRYTISLGENGNLMKYVYREDFTPESSSYPDPKDKNQYVAAELPSEIVDQETMRSLEARMREFSAFSQYSLSTQAICNAILAKYRELESQGLITKVIIDQK